MSETSDIASKKRCDIFPQDVSEEVDVLPDIPNFKKMAYQTIHPFSMYLNETEVRKDKDKSVLLPKVYYDQTEYNGPLQKHFNNLSAKITESKPKKKLLQWVKIHKKLIDANTKHFINTDQRTLFIIERNHFVVPQGFTSGVRHVSKGTGHLYITHSIPIEFYQLRSVFRKNIHATKRLFNPPHQQYFHHKRLQPHTSYLVPEGTIYLITLLENAFFAFHLVNHESKIAHITCVNPVKEKKILPKDGVRSLNGGETPMVSEERFERYEPADPVLSASDPLLLAFASGQEVRMSHLSPDPPPPVVTFASGQEVRMSHLSPDPPPPVVTFASGQEVRMSHLSPDPPPPVVTFASGQEVRMSHLSPDPPPPVVTLEIKQFPMERSVQVVAPEVVSWYQSLQKKKYDDPNPQYQPGSSEQLVPMDLRVYMDLESIVTNETMDTNQDTNQYQKLVKDLWTMDAASGWRNEPIPETISLDT